MLFAVFQDLLRKRRALGRQVTANRKANEKIIRLTPKRREDNRWSIVWAETLETEERKPT